jgi:predicted Zn-dependent peptidase
MPGGLELHLLPKPGFRSVHALLSVGYGAIDRRFALPGCQPLTLPDGVAHFLEHRLFASALGDVGDRFAGLGAEVNAHTTFTNTGYFFSCTDHLEACLELLLGFVLNPSFTAEGVQREREIITRELQLYGDNLEWISFFGVLQSLYGNHPLGVDIAGTVESIRGIDAGLLELCHRAFYRPDNMTLIVGGDFDLGAVADKVASCLEGRTSGPPPLLFRRPSSPARAQTPRQTLSIALPRICLGFGDLQAGLDGEALLKHELCLEVLLDLLYGASSDFYARHYESGLLDAESFGCEIYVEREFCFCLVGGDTPDPERLEGEILEELAGAVGAGVIERGFARAARRAYGQAVQRLDQVEGGVGVVFSSLSRGAGPLGLFAAHDQLEPEDLHQCLKDCLIPARRGTALVFPSDSAEEDGG